METTFDSLGSFCLGCGGGFEREDLGIYVPEHLSFRHEDCLPYYQPDLTESEHILFDLRSYEVYATKEIAQERWPTYTILEFWADDIEELVFVG